MKEWRPVTLLFLTALCGGAVGWLSAPLIVDDFADVLRPLTMACGMTAGLLVGYLFARRIFGGKSR